MNDRLRKRLRITAMRLKNCHYGKITLVEFIQQYVDLCERFTVAIKSI